MKIIQQKSISILFLILMALQACGPVRLISEYDELTDKTTLELQEKISSLFVKLERNIGTEKADYSSFTELYDEIRVSINTLEIRAAAIEKNKIIQDQVKEIKNMLDNLERLHKTGFASAEQLKPLQQPFNSAFTAITKLQMALKRGEK